MWEFLIKLVLVVFAAKVIDLLLLAAEERGWIYYRRSRGRSSSAASAFLELQSMVEPSRRHVVEERVREREEREDAGDPPEAGADGADCARVPFEESMDEILQEYAATIDGGTSSYKVRAIAVPRDDGMWEGVLEFMPVTGGSTLRGERETSQPNRDAVAYWASGLEPVYLAGALERALRNRR